MYIPISAATRRLTNGDGGAKAQALRPVSRLHDAR